MWSGPIQCHDSMSPSNKVRRISKEIQANPTNPWSISSLEMPNKGGPALTVRIKRWWENVCLQCRPGAQPGLAQGSQQRSQQFREAFNPINKSEADQPFKTFLSAPGIHSAEQRHIAPPPRWRFGRNDDLKTCRSIHSNNIRKPNPDVRPSEHRLRLIRCFVSTQALTNNSALKSSEGPIGT
jgi:hypothetical protein